MSENLESINNALKSENESLKEVIEKITIEGNTLKQTVRELIEMNITFKSLAAFYENRMNKLKSSDCAKTNSIKSLEDKVVLLENKITVLENSKELDTQKESDNQISNIKDNNLYQKVEKMPSASDDLKMQIFAEKIALNQ